ncbi:hypothetical protein VHARVF571_120097 [Vibrio harveyi]|nr:hypothetical protein VHARVF571_120097 [Vibrio harveyi]
MVLSHDSKTKSLNKPKINYFFQLLSQKSSSTQSLSANILRTMKTH